MWGLVWVYTYRNKKFGVCDQDECQVQAKHNGFHLVPFSRKIDMIMLQLLSV